MARTARPWYSAEKKTYFAYIKRRKVPLLKGEENPTNESLAAKKLRQILKSTKNETPQVGLLVAHVIERYLNLHKERYSERAFAERKRYLQLFAEAHGFRKVNDHDCLPVHLEEWLAEHPAWKSEWTRGQIVSIIMRPFNWAAKKRLISANPFRGVEKGQGEPRRPMTDAEFRQILIHATIWNKRQRPRKLYPSDLKRRQRPSPTARFRQVLVCLRFTGMRPGELRNLEWSDVDLDARELVIRTHKTSKKTHRPRRIPLHSVVVKLLIYIKRLNQPGTHVFLSHRKRPWHRVSLSQRLLRVRRAAGISEDAKLYGLRHAFGTRAIIKGVDLKTLSELLGHSSVRMTEHYTHLVGQRSHLADAMRKVNDSSKPPSDAPRPAS